MRFSILTLGCKVNQTESNYIENRLLRNSHCSVGLKNRPEICIVNTCSVTSKSDRQSRQLIRQALRTGARVYVTGCYSELSKDEIKSINEDIKIIDNKDKLSFINDNDNSCVETKYNNAGRSRAMVKIQDGCNARCSYCLIPIARGRSESRNISEILNEIKDLEASGYREVVLTGINIGLYGLDFDSRSSLSDLIEKIILNTRHIRLRLSSIEPDYIDERLVELLTEKRTCNHVHIPLQSGDDEILFKMKRNYTVKDYTKIIDNIFKSINNISIGTDIITGFPAESDVNFKNTCNYLSSIPLSYLHIFPYSKRKHTLAANIKDQISDSIKKERSMVLRDLSSSKKKKYMNNQINLVLPVIIERTNGSFCSGTTDNYLKIFLNMKKGIKGKNLIYSLVTGLKDSILIGKSL